MNKTNEKGITLIALVITIIVLLILAGVTIAMLSGNNSAPQKATEAAQKDAIASTKDEIAMEVQEAILNYYNNTYVATSSTSSSTTANTQSIVVDAASRALNNAKTRNSNILSSSGVNNNQITINTKSYSETGTISDKGAISWNGIVAANNGGETPTQNTASANTTTNTVTPELPVQTQDISILTDANYGQNIILNSTGISGVGQETNEDDWKIVYKDSNGKVYALLTDYLPNNNPSVSASGLNSVSKNTYGVNSTTSQRNLIEGLKHETAWKSLISSTLTTKYSAIEVYGALETTELETIKTLGTYYKASSANDYETTDCYGYWLAGETTNSYYGYYVRYNGRREWMDGSDASRYNVTWWGICPVVILPSDVQVVEKSTGVWEVK